jgi:hypothetical protein
MRDWFLCSGVDGLWFFVRALAFSVLRGLVFIVLFEIKEKRETEKGKIS